MTLYGDLKHVAGDVVNAPSRMATESARAFEGAGDAFRKEAMGLFSLDSSVFKQAKLFGEGVLTGAVLNPVNGVTQLLDKVPGVDLPKLELTNQEEVNKSWAGKIGTLGGSAADFVLTAGGAGAALGVEASSATALGTAGALQGGIFTPTADDSGKSLLTSRLENGMIGGAAGAVMGGVSSKVESNLSETLGDSTADKVKTKFLSGAAGGTASGAVKAEGKSYAETGEQATIEDLSQQVVGGAFTGAAGKVNSGLNESLTDSVAGRMTNSSVASASGGAAGGAAHAATERATQEAALKKNQLNPNFNFNQQALAATA